MPTARHRLCALFVLLPALPALATEPFSFDSAPGRLPKDVVPLDYTVAIQPDILAMAFDGTESVTLQLRTATATMTFNSLNETLRNVRLDGQAVQQVATDDAAQTTTVTLAAAAAAGRHVLSFAYRGRLETMARGLFVQPYVGPRGRKRLILSTKMESTEARRMFPVLGRAGLPRHLRTHALRCRPNWAHGRQYAGGAIAVSMAGWPRPPSSVHRGCRPT